MGIADAHPMALSHAKVETQPSEHNGRTVAIDIASWVRLFRPDAPDYFRSNATPQGFRSSMTRLPLGVDERLRELA